MDANAETIWQVPVYLPYLQPALTPSAIAAAEQTIGFKLPTEYLDLLRKQNGGYIRFGLPDSVHSVIAGIGPHFPSLTDYDWSEDQEYVSFPLQGLFPFDGDGHWHLCFDYRSNSVTPSIAMIDVECDNQSQIAPNFGEYLSLLKLQADDEFVLEGVSAAEVVKRLAAALQIEFLAADSWAHGYPIHSARVGSEAQAEWIWVSANLVPRGFVRREDPRYAELKDELPGIAPRFPTVPDDCTFVQATPGVQSRVLESLAQMRIPVRPLREFV